MTARYDPPWREVSDPVYRKRLRMRQYMRARGRRLSAAKKAAKSKGERSMRNGSP